MVTWLEDHLQYKNHTLLKKLIYDLLNHQFWADSIQWNALEKCLPALEDQKILIRLNHIHQGQHGFLLAVERREIRLPPEEMKDPKALKTYAIQTHRMIREFMQNMTEIRLNEKVSIPWFKDPDFKISCAEVFMQMTFHSHYHRGQNATRLRELGGEPPLTDLIVWYWKGRPAPQWDLDVK